MNVNQAVRERYSGAAQKAEAALCCPVNYNPAYLKIIPAEILERDYGCGDPSRWVQPGETVLDLGSGGGKICYIIAQIVGAQGQVIGVDCNDDMLKLARAYQNEVAQKLGYDNVIFRKGRIEDLQLDLELLEQHLQEQPVSDSSQWLQMQDRIQTLRTTQPMIADSSVDVVVSNCVLNLVHQQSRRQLFEEIFRVLKNGGRAVISDIVSDEDVPLHLQQDNHLWSGCISGAFREDEFLTAFEDAGFYGIELKDRQSKPWAVVDGIEFRSVTLQAFKGKEGPCLDQSQAVIYNGPWKAVIDDDGHKLYRGKRMAVCEKTFRLYTQPPYTEQITPIEPHHKIPLDQAPSYDCHRNAIRIPQETKAGQPGLTIMPNEDCCESDDCC